MSHVIDKIYNYFVSRVKDHFKQKHNPAPADDPRIAFLDPDARDDLYYDCTTNHFLRILNCTVSSFTEKKNLDLAAIYYNLY
jgi:hypothetical protein